MDLKNDVFLPVFKRLNNRKESLRHLKRFLGRRRGIEAWLKVEIVAALGEMVDDFRGRGADLLMRDGGKIELKAATDFNPRDIVKEGAEKHKAPCLFLADGRNDTPRHKQLLDNRIARFQDLDMNLIDHRILNCGNNNKWIIGLIEPAPNK